MGKIPEFQRDRFASTYVGAPQVDTSGVTAVEGINKAVQPVVDVAAKVMHDREVAMIDQQADSALIKYSLAYQQQMKDLEVQYANNTAEFPGAVAKLGMDLQAEYSAAIPDERIRTRFGDAANGVVKQASLASIKWVDVKNEENALLAAKDIVRTSALAAGQTLDPYLFKANIAATKEKILALPDVDQAKARTMLPDMFDSHLYARAGREPDALEADLNNPDGPYKDVPDFTDEIRMKWLDKIKTERRRQERELREVQTDTFQHAMLENTNRTLTIERIDELNNTPTGLREQDYRNLKEAVFNRIEADASKLYDREPDAKRYLEIIKQVVDSREERAKKTSKVLDVFKDEYMSSDERKQLVELTAPLRTAKQAVRLEDMGNRIAELERTAGVLFPAKQALYAANMVRSYLQKAAQSEDVVAPAKTVVNAAVLDKIRSLGYVTDGIPPQGMRIPDKNGNYIWLMPDGTYREE